MWRHPDVGRGRPAATLSVVVLPAPFGPSSANTVARGTAKLTPCTTSMRPYAARTSRSSSAGGAGASASGAGKALHLHTTWGGLTRRRAFPEALEPLREVADRA